MKIIIIFITINANLFLNFFSRFVLETINDKKHKILVLYLAKSFEKNIIVKIILQMHLIKRNDNILIFVFDVNQMFKIIENVKKTLNKLKTRFDVDEMNSLEC